ncbi:hypothetical protein CPB84DRAFT_1775083 [Gymnopilus junonius]|uniref:Uncharacterized protein n=1 Tax=Gymnopilus junonius TaxID=109634 RepID=A0A9P5TPK1_GYMJU|nr:hypothetical protein CPB84DRAFT_1775083 [Gymnopilus junonius]
MARTRRHDQSQSGQCPRLSSAYTQNRLPHPVIQHPVHLQHGRPRPLRHVRHPYGFSHLV